MDSDEQRHTHEDLEEEDDDDDQYVSDDDEIAEDEESDLDENGDVASIDTKDHNEQNISSADTSSGDDFKGLVGLQNLGNTCYMNGALQALSNCQQLTRFVLDCPGFIQKNGLSRSYQELINEMWSSTKTPPFAVPTSIIKHIKSIYPAFRGCTQQDTQEFLRCFLEQLHDELKRPVLTSEETNQDLARATNSKDEVTNESSSDSSQESVTAADLNDADDQKSTSKHERGSDKHVAQRSIISDTFEFRIASSVVCANCNNISTTKETFKDLSIPIPSRDHPFYRLRTCESNTATADCNTIDSTSQKSESSQRTGDTKLESGDDNSDEQSTDSSKRMLDDDDDTIAGSKSSQDGSSNKGLVQTVSSYLPVTEWLWSWWDRLFCWLWGPTVTLNDCLSIFFGTDPLEGDNEYSCQICTKKNKGVKYLKILELPEVLCIHFKRYESVGSAKITTHVSFPLKNLDLAQFMSEDSQSQCTTYNLVACICHHGSALLNGHYTTHALNCYDGNWYQFDDQYVMSVNEDQVENSEAYILFYQKTCVDNKTERQRLKASRLLQKSMKAERLSNENDLRTKYYISKQWVNKFNTFVEPGPITNHDFLCKHNRVPKRRQNLVGDLCYPVSETVWNYLTNIHGGGPVCRELTCCDECQ